MLGSLSGLIIILFLIIRSWRFRGKVNQVLLDKNNRIREQHSQLEVLNSMLKDQSEIDILTGLKNRRFITQFIAEQTSKPNNQNRYYLVIMDVDNFKNVNDTFGHQ